MACHAAQLNTYLLSSGRQVLSVRANASTGNRLSETSLALSTVQLDFVFFRRTSRQGLGHLELRKDLKMAFTRRGILQGIGASALYQYFGNRTALAELADQSVRRDLSFVPSDDQMAPTLASNFRPYFSIASHTPAAPTWIQIDLKQSRRIDSVKLYPGFRDLATLALPRHLRIEVSEDADFSVAQVLVDYTTDVFKTDPGAIATFQVDGKTGRFVRVTATELIHGISDPGYLLILSKVSVVSDGIDVAEGCVVSVDPIYGNRDAQQITRKMRPMGEGIVTDHPENVTGPDTWHFQSYQVHVPTGGIALKDGLFLDALQRNIRYLLLSSYNELVRQFRQRANKPVPSGLPPLIGFWETDLPGSSTGRFLMGAANTLRWVDHPELRRRMNLVVDEIEACMEPSGNIMAYREDEIFHSERAAYTRAWVTHGLLEASLTGNQRALKLLRAHYDWFNRRPYMSKLLRGATQGVQGTIASTRVYHSPVGKPEDLQVVQRYFQENYWLDGLAKGDEAMVWQYPYDGPHCYRITNYESHLDLFRATGDSRYLSSVLGAWNLIHDKWVHVGGSIAICEIDPFPPESYRLTSHTGEFCGTSFWVFLNQRLHCLYPEEEKYMHEIERSIYNVALASFVGERGFRYHTTLMGKKDTPTHINTCCEGQGTRLIGSLPEHIYSIGAQGIHVNLFESSHIDWVQDGQKIGLTMESKFPFNPAVHLNLYIQHPAKFKIFVRIPRWASKPVAVICNGQHIATGQPGTYLAMERQWQDKDEIAFVLPMELRMTRYEGEEKFRDVDRFAFEYGPILLALTGASPLEVTVNGIRHYDDLLNRIKPDTREPLTFSIDGVPGKRLVPYWLVGEEDFSCFPVCKIGMEAV